MVLVALILSCDTVVEAPSLHIEVQTKPTFYTDNHPARGFISPGERSGHFYIRHGTGDPGAMTVSRRQWMLFTLDAGGSRRRQP